ncbi:hypothetical protein R6Q59_007206 [Mikania micrantha]
MWPFPSIENVDIFYIPVNVTNQHWCLAVIDFPKWTMTVYDRDARDQILGFLDTMFPTWLAYNNYDMGLVFSHPPFIRERPNAVPHQKGLLGDCGVWFLSKSFLVGGVKLQVFSL